MNATPPVYFQTLNIENVRCFEGSQELDLTINGRPAQWSLLIGENGVGKTTLLECLAWMRPVPKVEDSSPGTAGTGEIPPLTNGTLTPALQEAENRVLETLPRDLSKKVKLSATLAFGGVGFHSSTGSVSEPDPSSQISVGMSLGFDERGELQDLELTSSTQIEDLPQPLHDPLIVVYGANRHLGERNLSRFPDLDPLEYERLSWITELCDVEELLMFLDYASGAKDAEIESRVLDLLKDTISRVLPEKPAVEIEIHPPDILGTGRQGGVYAKTFTGLVRMSALSLGYRTTTGWVVDFAWRLSNRYRSSPNPFSEPAVVMIDEIDLHLHPRWQRLIINELTALFPATQFIVTSHSPLIVQVAEDAKLIMLGKQEQEGRVAIENDLDMPRNLRVDQILTSLLFGIQSSRSPSIQLLLDERAALLDKMDRTEEEDNRLRDIRREIDGLPVAHDPEDLEAMDLIRRFAASLGQEEESGS